MSALEGAGFALDAAGVPFSARYGDVYHSRGGGAAQARAVFLAGNGLPGRWADRPVFSILEVGFGLGTNFLATWEAWRADPGRAQRLHVVSIEQHPLSAAELASWHGEGGERSGFAPGLAEALIRDWPVAVPGMHQLSFDGGRVVLTLVFAEAGAALSRLAMRIDAFYLDGFAPARNPQAWSLLVMKGLARLAADGATVATYSVAREVVRALGEVGFEVRKVPGFGAKREQLNGRFAPRYRVRRRDPPAPADWPCRHALVVGGGIAGCALAFGLARRGWTVDVLEAAGRLPAGASAIPAGAVHPVFTPDDSILARLTRAGFLHHVRLIRALRATEGVPDSGFHACGFLHRLAGGAAAARTLLARLGAPPEYARPVDVPEACAIAGVPVRKGGWFAPWGGMQQPDRLCQALLAAHASALRLRLGCPVSRLEACAGGWMAIDAAGQPIAQAPVAVLAGGAAIARAPGLRALLQEQGIALESVRGQLSGVAAERFGPLATVLGGEGLCLPALEDRVWIGASYAAGDDQVLPRAEDHAHNIERAARLAEFDRERVGEGTLLAQVGFRAVSADRMPVLGPLVDSARIAADPRAWRGSHLADLPRRRGLYVASALGSRGLTLAALLGEALASLVCSEPVPLERDLLESIDPARFVLRTLRRAR
jgi:tRNA 5-methylaminomethyl-2-thiouridine biosynthesis bifunctional protein